MKWTRGPVIGHGSSATVSLATDAVSGGLFAVKHTQLSRSLPLQKEQSILSRLRPSPHIIKYLGSDITVDDGNNLVYNLHIEYVSGGTLHDTIRTTVRGFLDDELDIKSYTRGILRGLEHLHLNGVAHCDVKSQNVLVAGDGAVKIADLGCAKLVVGETDSSSSCFSGTPMFMAPEVVRGEEQGLPADVWALGCTVIEMATGKSPWPDSVSVLYRVGFSGGVPEIPRWMSEEARDFLEKCLRRDPRERWTVGELLLHPFIGGKEFVGLQPSPIGVLDWGFWESGDGSSSSSSQSHIDGDDDRFVCYDDGLCSSSDCASERIKKLMIGEFDATAFGWTDGGDWVVVRRSNDEEEEEEYDNVRVIDLISEETLYENSVILISEEADLYRASLMEDEFVLTTPMYDAGFMNINLLEMISDSINNSHV